MHIRVDNTPNINTNVFKLRSLVLSLYP